MKFSIKNENFTIVFVAPIRRLVSKLEKLRNIEMKSL